MVSSLEPAARVLRNGISGSPLGDDDVGATVQARAFVRIVSAVTLRLGEGPLQGEAPLARDTKVHTDGETRPARLIEFQ